MTDPGHVDHSGERHGKEGQGRPARGLGISRARVPCRRHCGSEWVILGAAVFHPGDSLVTVPSFAMGTCLVAIRYAFALLERKRGLDLCMGHLPLSHQVQFWGAVGQEAPSFIAGEAKEVFGTPHRTWSCP